MNSVNMYISRDMSAMCCNVVAVPTEVIQEIIKDIEQQNPAVILPDWPARRISVFPKDDVPLLVFDEDNLSVKTLRWGYEPSWSKSVLFNTRVETASGQDRSFWTESLLERRCVVPTLGFYEPHSYETIPSSKTGKQIKQQYFFELPTSSVLFIAGIYEQDHFSLMTTEPNRWMAPIHNRMPLVLAQDEVLTWFSDSYATLFDRSDVELLASKAKAQ